MKKTIIKIVTAMILFVIALTIKFENVWINNVLFILSYLIVGLEVVLEAIEHIFKGKVFDENFLMTVATVGAFAIGEFPEAVAVMLFYQIGEFFQDIAVDKSRKSITNLMDIRPDFANVVNGSKIEKVSPENVKIGDVIIVKPGEKVPLDGKVIEGSSMLDTMALTGESVPRKVKVDDGVLSGCINKTGLIKIEVSKEYKESTVSKILDLVENASNKKSKSEKFITKFAKYYTPTVVIIAVLLAVAPPLILKEASFVDWIYRALSFLVVSCPCALVISIPLSFFGGIGGASKIGILIKGSNHLEDLANTEIAVFDKTGTLTKGVFDVQKISTMNCSKEELLKIAAYAENYSNHPIAESVKRAYNKKVDVNQIEKIEELAGLGISAKVFGKNVLIGNEKLMDNNQIDYKKCKEIGTILYIAIENKFAGYMVIADELKKDSAAAIGVLKANNIKETVMLTGDRKNIGEEVAKVLRIDKVYAELLPDEKVKKVEELLKEKSPNGKLAFVGDGINDAPVLALADIGIAMGGIGSDAAIEAADVVIMTDEPSKVASAIKISKKTLKIVKQNIVFAIGVKIAILIFSAMGLATMWAAVFADVGVSIIAVINALRALKVSR